DKAGNSGGATESGINIDKTDPNVAVSGVQDGAEYVLGSAPVPSCAASDELSGLVAAAHLAVEGGSVNGVGTFTATCSATDLAGNSAGAAKTYQVVYGGLSGILQPINADGSSLFSRGRAVPVKFRLDGDPLPSGFASVDWQLQRVLVSCETETEYSSENVGSVTPSTTFRYDATADQYVYNADFRDKAAGTCWKVRVTLDSGQVLDSAKFKLQR
ncbi:MAG: PxKF domain-containing protein, partial [Gaiellaceae bacterium]